MGGGGFWGNLMECELGINYIQCQMLCCNNQNTASRSSRGSVFGSFSALMGGKPGKLAPPCHCLESGCISWSLHTQKTNSQSLFPCSLIHFFFLLFAPKKMLQTFTHALWCSFLMETMYGDVTSKRGDLRTRKGRSWSKFPCLKASAWDPALWFR